MEFLKGTRQTVIVTHNPSEIDQNQLLLIRFPNLGSDDPKRTLVSNVGTAIVKKLAVKFEGIEILSIDNFDIFACYRDLWKTKSEKRNAIRQGIISNDECTENCMKLRINAGDKNASDKKDNAIAETYGNKFIILLTLKCLTVPFHITKRDSETGYVTKLHSMITTKSLNP